MLASQSERSEHYSMEFIVKPTLRSRLHPPPFLVLPFYERPTWGIIHSKYLSYNILQLSYSDVPSML